MKGLITDRNQDNVSRRNELSLKGWASMTESERTEWLGDPLAATGANLMSCGPFYSSAVSLKYNHDSIVATTNAEGIYLYAISIIGEASKYEGKTFTLSADHIGTADGGNPQIALYWHDDNGFEFAGASLSSAGSVTFTVYENTAERAYLALYVYVTADVPVSAGAAARFGGVMLENGSERHEYAPFIEVLSTPSTKGAYNYSDLNRVERAVAEISNSLGLGLVTKTDWAMWDIPTMADMERYLYNLNRVRERCFDVGKLPTLPTTMDRLTYTVANDIETILISGHTTAQLSYRPGELVCGEV